MDNTTDQPRDPKRLSDDDKKKLEDIRDKNTEFLKEQIVHIKVQAEYAQLKASIVESQYKESYYKLKLAEMSMHQKDAQEQEKKAKS